MEHYFKLSVDEWQKRFKPIPNLIDKNASWGGGGDWNGIMYETFGKELEVVLAVDHLFVWTYVDGDNGVPCVVSGYHICNRIGYFICSVPVNGKDEFEVDLGIESDELDQTEDEDEDNG
jgi:hypothetical protein